MAEHWEFLKAGCLVHMMVDYLAGHLDYCSVDYLVVQMADYWDCMMAE